MSQGWLRLPPRAVSTPKTAEKGGHFRVQRYDAVLSALFSTFCVSGCGALICNDVRRGNPPTSADRRQPTAIPREMENAAALEAASRLRNTEKVSSRLLNWQE